MCGNPQSNATVDTASATKVVFAVLVQHLHLVTQKPGTVVMSMSHQSFLLVELHMKIMVEKVTQLLLDGLSFALRAGEP
jgi:hypothetical protein